MIHTLSWKCIFATPTFHMPGILFRPLRPSSWKVQLKNPSARIVPPLCAICPEPAQWHSPGFVPYPECGVARVSCHPHRHDGEGERAESSPVSLTDHSAEPQRSEEWSWLQIPQLVSRCDSSGTWSRSRQVHFPMLSWAFHNLAALLLSQVSGRPSLLNPLEDNDHVFHFVLPEPTRMPCSQDESAETLLLRIPVVSKLTFKFSYHTGRYLTFPLTEVPSSSGIFLNLEKQYSRHY